MENESLRQNIASLYVIFDSIVVSIPACHAGDRGSIPRQRDNFFFFCMICCMVNRTEVWPIWFRCQNLGRFKIPRDTVPAADTIPDSHSEEVLSSLSV